MSAVCPRPPPFPGPGLAIRIPGDITPERVAMLQKADAILGHPRLQRESPRLAKAGGPDPFSGADPTC
jgi:GMP synthase PP-ATPase subunit